MLVKFNLEKVRQHRCESWRISSGRVPTDYHLSERLFLPKALLQETKKSQT